MKLVFIILAALIPLSVSGNRIAACRKLCGMGHQGSASNIFGRGNLGMSGQSGLSESVAEPCWRPLDLNGGSENSLGSPMIDDNGNPMHVVRFPRKDSDGNGIFGLYFPARNKVLTNEGTEYTPTSGMGIDIMYAPPGTSALLRTSKVSVGGDKSRVSPLLVDSQNLLCIPIIPSAYDPSELRATKAPQPVGIGESYYGCSGAGRTEICGEEAAYLHFKLFHIIYNPLARSPGPQRVKECSSDFSGSKMGRSPNRRSAGFLGASSRRNSIPRDVAATRSFYQMNNDYSMTRACWLDIEWGEPIPELYLDGGAGLVKGPEVQSRRDQSPGYLTLVGEEYGVYYPNLEFPLWVPMVYGNNLTSPPQKLQLLYHSGEGDIVWIPTNPMQMKDNPPANAIKIKSFQTNFQFLCIIDVAQHAEQLRAAYNALLGLVDVTTGLCHVPFDICEYGTGKIATFVDFNVVGNTPKLGVEFEEPEEAPRCPERNSFRNY